ncbi:MAG: DUF4349 domain-containing protein [Brooklawnia sp.]|jgi:hypothetical protein
MLGLVAVLGATLLGACSSPMSGGGSDSAPQVETQGHPGEAAPADGGSVPQAPVEDTDRMIIRTQTLRLQVGSTEDAMGSLRDLAEQHSATVENMQLATDDGWVHDSPGSNAALHGWATVRVPVAGISAFTEDVAELGKVVYQAETADDVTQQHIDLSARLENLRAHEERLRDLIAEAANVEETLAVEQELWRVRGEIESLDAQVTWLERQSEMATVTVEFTEPGPVVSNWGFLDAVRNGISSAVALLASLVTFVIASSPIWLLGIAGYFIARGVRRRRREARGEPAPLSRKERRSAGTTAKPPAEPVDQAEPGTQPQS